MRFIRPNFYLAAFAVLAMAASPASAATVYNSPTPASPVMTKQAAPIAKTAPVTAPTSTTAAPAPSDVTLQLARAVGTACPGHWDSATCLSAVSSSNLVLASNYGAALQNAGHPNEAEQVKQHCAAATAAREKTFPAYAMKSAFIECANMITDLAGKTGINPDPSAFQLLIAPTLCLDNDPRCGAISDQLKRFAAP